MHCGGSNKERSAGAGGAMATGSSGCQPRYLVTLCALVPQHSRTALFNLACGSLIYLCISLSNVSWLHPARPEQLMPAGRLSHKHP
jgi:hypothetical protein